MRRCLRGRADRLAAETAHRNRYLVCCSSCRSRSRRRRGRLSRLPPVFWRPPDSTRRSRRTSSQVPWSSSAAPPKSNFGVRPAAVGRTGHLRPKAPMPNRVCPFAEAKAHRPSPKGRVWEHTLDRQVASIAFEAKLPTPTQRSAGDTVQCQAQKLTFRKTHEPSAPNSQLIGHHPKMAAILRPAARKPLCTSRPAARHDWTPESIHEPEGSACATMPQTGVPRHTGARNATPISPRRLTSNRETRIPSWWPKPPFRNELIVNRWVETSRGQPTTAGNRQHCPGFVISLHAHRLNR